MLKVKMLPPRDTFNGKLAGINWVEGKAVIATISQKLSRGYGVVEDKEPIVETIKVTIEAPEIKEIVDEAIEKIKDDLTPVDTAPEDGASVTGEGMDDIGSAEAIEEGAKELAQVVEEKKQEIEAKASQESPEDGAPVNTMKKSEVKSEADFTGSGSFGKYKSYVKELTGTSPRNKEQCAEALEAFKAGLPE